MEFCAPMSEFSKRNATQLRAPGTSVRPMRSLMRSGRAECEAQFLAPDRGLEVVSRLNGWFPRGKHGKHRSRCSHPMLFSTKASLTKMVCSCCSLGERSILFDLSTEWVAW